MRVNIQRLVLWRAGGIVGHNLIERPDFGHRRAHAITKPFAHLGNCSLRAGGTVYLDDQLAPCQFHIGKNRRAVIHGRDEGPLAFGRLRLLVLRRWCQPVPETRSEEHTSELQSLMRISYAVFCLKKKNKSKSKIKQTGGTSKAQIQIK